MTKHGIMIDKLETHGNERLQNGMTFMVKSLKGYRELIQFFREGGCDPWGEKTKDKVTQKKRFIRLTPSASESVFVNSPSIIKTNNRFHTQSNV